MIEELDHEAWARFASDAGITLPFLRRRIIAMTDAVLSVIDEARTSSAIAVQTGLRAAMLRQSLD